MRTWCVYMHENRLNGKKYIGITCQTPEKRWNEGRGYSGCRHFFAAIQRYGWDAFNHEILFTGLTQLEAERLEVELIEKYQTRDPENGYNLAEGGRVSRGYSLSEETRARISRAHQGMKGPPVSEETRAKISKALKGKYCGERHPMYGTHPSPETRAKLSAARKGRPSGNSKAVLCLETGEAFNSALEASRKTGVHRAAIGRACRGERDNAGGLHWQFINTKSIPAPSAGSL